MELPDAAIGGGRTRGRNDGVHRPPGGFVRSFHGRQVGIRAYVVRGEEQVGNTGKRIRPESPRVDLVDEQEFAVAVLHWLRRNIGIEEPGQEMSVSEATPTVLELLPRLVRDLLRRGLERGLPVRLTRLVPLGDIDGDDAVRRAIPIVGK